MKIWEAIKFTLINSWQASKNLLLFYVIIQAIIALSSIVNLITFKEVVDSATNVKTIFGLSVIGILILRLIYEWLKKTLEGISNYTWALIDSKQVVYMNRKFIDKLATLDLATIENPKNITLIQRAFNRFQFQFKFYLNSIVNVFASLTELAVSITIFFFASPIIGLIMVIANLVPILNRIKHSEGKFLIFRADAETKMKFEYTSWNLLTRDVIPEVKINRAFDFFKKRLINIYQTYNKKQLILEKKYQLLNTLAESLPILAIFIFSVFIAGRLANNSISTGTFVFLFTNVFVFAGALQKLGNHIGQLDADSHFINEAVEYFNLQPKVIFPVFSTNKKQSITKQLSKPTIKIENLSFKYPNNQNFSLNNINLEIPYGQNFALVGENGAGKTTLVKLLMRIYDPAKGQISINGIDLKEIPEEVLCNTYSTLFQNFGKFYMTIEENLQMAAGKKLSDEEMIYFLKFSNAWEFIKDTKYKLKQQLGPEYKHGLDLSGGQWQRLAIARAYAKRAPILILDEPTSAVDAKSEMEIFDRLNREMKENTLIFISHRFSTIKDAERIVVLDKGKLIEDGTHSQLIKNQGKYAQLYTIQAERYKRR